MFNGKIHYKWSFCPQKKQLKSWLSSLHQPCLPWHHPGRGAPFGPQVFAFLLRPTADRHVSGMTPKGGRENRREHGDFVQDF